MATYAQSLPALTTGLFQPKWGSGMSDTAALSTDSYFREPTVPAWLQPTIGSFQSLLQLPNNWDGYGANQIQEQIVQQLLMLLVGLLSLVGLP